MKKGDETEMGEVVHSTLMPSLLSDQILVFCGGIEVWSWKEFWCYEVTLYVNPYCTCQPTEISLQEWEGSGEVPFYITDMKTFLLISLDFCVYHCGSIP